MTDPTVTLFNRDMVLQFGAVTVPMRSINPLTKETSPSLRCVFTVEKDSDSAPNKATASVYNLNSAHRAAVIPKFPLIVSAGYTKTLQQLFSGVVKSAESRREGINWVTNVEAEDSGILDTYSTIRVSASFGPGTTMATFLSGMALALGVGLGNSIAKFSTPLRPLVAFKKGVSVSDRVVDILDRYVPALGYRWSIQDGNLQVLGKDETLLGTAVVLNQGTGLIGVPESGEKGWIKGRSLLQGAISPGKLIVVETDTVKGPFKVDKVTHMGDTWGGDWYSDFEAKPIA